MPRSRRIVNIGSLFHFKVITNHKAIDKMANSSTPPSLSKLLAALAVGVRAANNLPEDGDDSHGESSDDEEGGGLNGEFTYQMAFPEFNSLCLEIREYLSTMLNKAIDSSTTGQLDFEGGPIDENYEFDDPRLWETAAEMCDVLLERVDIYIQNAKEGRAGLDLEHFHSIRHLGSSARNTAKEKFDLLTSSIIDMEKPQITFGFADDVQNSRIEPFCPHLHPQSSCTLELVPGHGLDSLQYGGTIPEDIIAPTHHYLHPYQNIIEEFGYRDEQFITHVSGPHGRSGTLQNENIVNTKGIWIDTEDNLSKLVNRIEQHETEYQEIAIDLEAHNYRSFSGFVCTMQLSLRRPTLPEGELVKVENEDIDTAHDFIIDTLALRNLINKYMAPIFANPNIVKVMHGADSDIKWLQRDFGIYVVNLFDTGKASRILPHFTSSSLAYLLLKYANIEADKKHQLSDWRQRPINDEMLRYAISDTKYLLDIYEKMKLELVNEASDDRSIKSVLDASRKICLVRFDKEPFIPNGYKNIITSKRGKRKKVILSNYQDSVLKALFDWRDATAREEDESVQYVCPNAGLIRIAMAMPQNIVSLQACLNPMPELVLKYSNHILHLIKDCLHNNGVNQKSYSQKNIQKALHNSAVKTIANSVLDTDSLFKQAGWISPQVKPTSLGYVENASVTSEETNGDLTVQVSNDNFHSNIYTNHSLEMRNIVGDKNTGRGRSVDGLGAARNILDQNQGSSQESNSVENQNIVAQKCAGNIRNQMIRGDQNLLGLMKTSVFIDDSVDDAPEEEIEHAEDGCEGTTDNDEIPKSMKDIYRISNRNRRRPKKSAHIHDEGNEVSQAEIGSNHSELKEADSILATSGFNGSSYFEMGASIKRTKIMGHGEVQKTASDKDTDFMTDLGWVKDKKEAAMIADYSYSSISNMRMYDPEAPVEANPFFTGAAITGGSGILQQNAGKQDKKRTSSGMKKGKRITNNNKLRQNNNERKR